ncbi:MAG TPA: hypothetical protein VJV74_07245 [Terriglobia bacterium]|nr:hypothetical protein [Terriglobia bacterium]
MKRANRCFLLLGVLVFVWNLPGAHRMMLAVCQESAAHPPDVPPGGPPMPGEPIQVRPKPPQQPDDFEQGPHATKAQGKKMSEVQAQKDAEELAALAKKVQGEVDDLSKNVLSKDLDRDLKQIRKLAQRLRGEIAP